MDIATAVDVAQSNGRQSFSIASIKKAVEHEKQIVELVTEAVQNTPHPSTGRGQVVDTYA